MNTILKGASTLAVGALAAAILSLAAGGWMATRPDLLLAVMEDTTLFRVSIPAVAAELEDSDVVRRLNTGPLELTRGDIVEILSTRFAPVDVAMKAREVHAGLIRHVRSFPEDTVFRISIRRERPILAFHAERRVVGRFRELTDCGLGTDIVVLGRAARKRIFGSPSDMEFLEGLPHCWPPDAVGAPVVDGVRAEFRRLRLDGVDSVDVFPDRSSVSPRAYATRIRRIQTLDYLFGRAPGIVGGSVILLLASLVSGGRRIASLPDRWAVLVALGVGLALWGLVFQIEEVPRRVLATFGGEPGQGSEARRLWLNLGEYALRSLLRPVGVLLASAGGLVTAAGVTGLLATRGAREASESGSGGE